MLDRCGWNDHFEGIVLGLASGQSVTYAGGGCDGVGAADEGRAVVQADENVHRPAKYLSLVSWPLLQRWFM